MATPDNLDTLKDRSLVQPAETNPVCDIGELKYFRRLYILLHNWDVRGVSVPVFSMVIFTVTYSK